MGRENQFDNVAIVGLGLIGGSIAKDLRAHYPDTVIHAIDPNRASIDEAVEEGIIDGAIDYQDIGRVANLVVLASPLDVIQEHAERVASSLRVVSQRYFEKYVVIDTASVKAPISRQFADLTQQGAGVEFVATHPMAGTEYSGFKHARKDLFRAKPWIITPHESNTTETNEALTELFHGLGAKVRQIDPEMHDEYAGLVSHSVIMLSNLIFDYVATHHPEALELAGDGFISTTRLASGNPDLHKSIVQNNPDYTFQHLIGFAAFLEDKIATTDVKDDAMLLDYFKRNMGRRNTWLRRRK